MKDSRVFRNLGLSVCLVIAIALTVAAPAGAGSPAETRMPDGKRWTLSNLDVDIPGAYCYEPMASTGARPNNRPRWRDS